MKAVVKYGLADKQVEIRDVDEPTIGPTDVLLEMKAAGVCGSLHVEEEFWRDRIRCPVNVPAVQGHEFWGVIAEVGADVSGFAVGGRVVSETGAHVCGARVVITGLPYEDRKEVTGMSPLDDLQSVVDAVSIPIQAVGGLSVEQAVEMPSLGAPLIVLGAPLVVDAHEFSPAASEDKLERLLSDLVRRAKATPMLSVEK